MTTESQTEQSLDASRVLAYLRDTAPRPLSEKALREGLELPEERAEELGALLGQLVDDGQLIRTREARYGCPSRMNLVVGRLSAHRDGYGFVVAEEPDQNDLFVPGRKLGEAMHGDRVVGRIEHVRRSGRREGRIIRILDRARTGVVGRVRESAKLTWVAPLDARIGHDVVIPPDQLDGARPGQLVYAELVEFPSANHGPTGRVVEVLGEEGDPRVDIEVIIREHGLRHEFPGEVVAEAEAVSETISEAELEDREDYRELPIVTIDGENAQDFDDAVYVERAPNGNYRLHIHVADVAHYVPTGSALDVEARRRGTSTYFPDRVLPMLPESLSNGICSLRPEADRLVHSVIVEIDEEGKTVNYELHDGVIRSAARLTYEEVAAVLEDPAGEAAERLDPHVRQLQRMHDLAQVLIEYRQGRGGIDFDLPVPDIVINLRGEIESIVKAERNIAHRIIEEFMIRANEVTASHLTWEGVQTLYRVHDGPDPDAVESFREFISGLGHTLEGGRSPRPRHFAELLARALGRPEERVISLRMLRTMKQARYQVENEGHFGLAAERYSHFTSPIRRYPDLVVHRLLKHERGSKHVPEFDFEALTAQLEAIGAECSSLERNAERAERAYCDWKKVQFMADKVGEVYEGYVTGVESFGLFVELAPYFVEGLVPVSTLGDDYYRFDEAKRTLQAEHGGRKFSLGDRVKINLIRVDHELRRLDFSLEEGPLEAEGPPPPQPTRSRRRGGSRRGRRSRGRQRSGDKPREDKVAETVVAESAKEGPPPSAAAESGKDGDSGGRRRRRRGRRGGRGRRRSCQGAQASSESLKGGGGDARKSAAEPQQAGADQRQSGDEQRDGGRRRSSRRRSSSSGDGDKGEGRSGRGRQRSRGQRSAKGDKRSDDQGRQRRSGRGRGRGGRRPRNEQRDKGRPEVGAAPKPAAEPVRQAEPPKDKDDSKSKPKVNPYLTEIDF